MSLAQALLAIAAFTSLKLVAADDSCPAVTKPQVDVDGLSFYYKGCGKHALAHEVTSTILDGFTVEACVEACVLADYKVAGVMNGNSCYCDNVLSSAAPKLDDSECNKVCTGDPYEYCGGVWHYDIYFTNKTSSIPAPTAPSTVGSGNSTYTLEGCYTDSTSSRALSGDYYRGDDVTPTQCASYCYSKNFKYAGVEFGLECFCSQQLLNTNKVDDSQCNQACSGDSSQVCGAADRLNVYVASNPPTALTAAEMAGTNEYDQYIHTGCFSDSFDTRSLTGHSITVNDLTPSMCASHCFNMGFKYAGLEMGRDCFCGNSLPADRQVDSSRCDVPCGGDPTHSCGGGLRLDIYVSLLLAWVGDE
ncbi:WSC-domain-containing protein [Serendipita vermifera]|nr:WSC-domain-containing protein [Serendipita vermifera]